MDAKPGLKRKAVPLDAGRAERGVWLIKVPQFLATQWQALPLLQEREAARGKAEPVLVAALVPVLRALHARSELAPGWESSGKAAAFGVLLTQLEASGSIPSGVLTPAASAGASRDAFAGVLPALRALVDADTRLALSAAGRPRTQRLGEAARSALVPTGGGFAQATLGGAVAALLAQPAEARAAALADDAALATAVTDAARAVAAARVPAAQIASGAIAAHLVPAGDAPAAGGEPMLGRVRMSYDPCAAPPAPAEFSLTLGGAAAEGLPREYDLRRAVDVLPVHVFGEPAATASVGPGGTGYVPLAGLPPGGVASAEGVVERKFDVAPADADDGHYRRLNRARMAAACTKTRVAKQVATFASLSAAGAPDGGAGGARGRGSRTPALEAAPLRVPLPARQNVLSKAALAGGRAPDRRGRMEADALQARLFSLFEERSHWKIAELERRTDQPMAHLKQVLSGIAEMDRTPGPTRGFFQLLAHLRPAEPPQGAS